MVSRMQYHALGLSALTNNGWEARDHDFDVVLIDTAGRMQDNEVRPTLHFVIANSINALLFYDCSSLLCVRWPRLAKTRCHLFRNGF